MHDRLLRDLVDGTNAAFVFVNYTPVSEDTVSSEARFLRGLPHSALNKMTDVVKSKSPRAIMQALSDAHRSLSSDQRCKLTTSSSDYLPPVSALGWKDSILRR